MLFTSDVLPLFDIAGPADLADAYVSGWGRVSTGGPVSDKLKGTPVTIDASCGAWPSLFPDWDNAVNVCASGFPSGTCSGDSGGPLVVNSGGVMLLAGLVSFGSSLGCASDPTLPDVYTRVSTYVDWIEGHTGPLRQSTTAITASTQPSIAPTWAEPGKTYAVRIHAENGVGPGGGIVGSFSVFLPPPPPPPPVVVGPTPSVLDCTRQQPHPFIDLSPSSFTYDAAGCIFDLGVTTGTSAVTYSPAASVTRKQMAAFIARFYEAVTGEPCVGAQPFVDVASTSYVFDSVACVYCLGITTGTSATTYSPASKVTREQMAAFLARLYNAITG